ncbi:MAG: GNAT family N-acetyltransferase, partial [Acidimicrobiales bacterium]
MYEEFSNRALKYGCVEMRAITAPSNTDSVRFHQSVGFTLSEPVADYNGPGRAMVTFRCRLGAWVGTGNQAGADERDAAGNNCDLDPVTALSGQERP